MQFYETKEQYLKKRLFEFIIKITHKKRCFKIAKTAEECNQIYRFRYKIYYESLGRLVEGTDHRHKMIRDELDLTPNTLQLYMGDINNPSLVMRIILWAKGQMPSQVTQDYDLNRFEWINKINAVEFGRLMADPKIKSPFNVLLFLGALVNYLAKEHHTALILASCKPGLVMRYLLLGLYPYTNKLIEYPDGIEVPLAAFMDMKYYLQSHSPLGPAICNQTIVHEDWLNAFFASKSAIIFDKINMLTILKQKFCRKHCKPSSNLLSFLINYDSYIIDIDEPIKLAHKGSQKRELYYLLSGKAFNYYEGVKKQLTGFLIDEVYVSNQDQYYLQDLFINKGQVLVIRHSTISRLKFEHVNEYLELLHLIHKYHDLKKPRYRRNVFSSYEL